MAQLEHIEAIEADYDSLRGVLPKSEYQELDNTLQARFASQLPPI